MISSRVCWSQPLEKLFTLQAPRTEEVVLSLEAGCQGGYTPSSNLALGKTFAQQELSTAGAVHAKHTATKHKGARGKDPPSNRVLLASSTDKTLCLLAMEKCLKAHLHCQKNKKKKKQDLDEK